MTCRRAPKAHVLSVVSLLITIFAVLTALLAPAELRGGVQPSTKATDVAMPQDASAPLFLPAAIYDSGGQLGWYIAVADLNGDGKPDMVVVNYGGNANGDGWLGVLLGKGNGSFQPVVSYDPGGGGPTAVAIGDLNNDGKLDLVVGNQGCRVINSQCLGVLLGNGDGTFQPVVIYENDGQSYGGGPGISVPIFIADLNGDTKPDLLIANQTGLGQVGDGVVGVLLGKGDGTFEPVVGYDSGGFGTSAAAMADVNGDGKLDVVVVNCGSQSFYCPATAGTVGILLGNGDGTFQSVKTYSRGGAGSLASPVVVADVNRDGRLDVLVGNVGNDCPQNGNCVGDGTVGVLLGNGNGTFQTAVTYDAGSGSTISMAVADLNGDGKLDLAVANNGTSVLLGNGDGIFQPAQSYAGGGCCQILVADLNLDGRPDLLNVAGTSTAVNLYLGKGDGTFEAPQTVSLGGTEFSRVTVADVNEDRKPDLLAANWCADPCSGQEGTVGALLNNTQTDTTPPVITLAAAPKILWPPKGKMVPVRVSGTITDTGSGVNVSSAAYSVTDEYGEVQPAAGISLGAGGSYSFTVLLQASRLGSDLDGRQYTITVRASDNAGNSASQASVVTVPHDRGE